MANYFGEGKLSASELVAGMKSMSPAYTAVLWTTRSEFSSTVKLSLDETPILEVKSCSGGCTFNKP